MKRIARYARGWLAAGAALLVLCLAAASGEAAIALDYANSDSDQTSALSWSHTVGTGSNRLLLVGISIDKPDRTVGTVKWGGASGTALSFIDRKQGNATTVEIWGLKNPASGSSTIYATIAGGSNEWMVGGSASYTGVDQTTPWSGFTSAAGKRGDSQYPSLSVSSASGNLVFDVIAINDDQLESYNATVGANQTQVWQKKESEQSILGAASTEAGASSVTMTWSFPTNDYIWAYAALSINAGASYQPDAAIKLGSEGTGSYLTNDTYETTASAQAKSQSVVSGSTATYNILFQNDSSASDSLVVTQASATNCTDYTIAYLDNTSTDRTSSVTGSGYTISGMAAAASQMWTVTVTPSASIGVSAPACVVAVTATSSGDGTKTDQVKATTTALVYRPDAQIKLSSEGAGSYLTDGTYETTASVQAKSQGALSGSTASYNILFQNDSTQTDSLVVTQASATNCTDNYTIQYLDDTSTDRTSSVTGSGYTISSLAAAGSKTWTLNVTPTAAINGSASACVVSVTATSSGDGTKTDQVKATTTSSSASLTLLKSADRATAGVGDDIVYTVNATNGSGLSSASSVVITDPVPTHTGYKVGSASFSAGTSTLSGTAVFSNDSGSTWSYTPSSTGCSAPSGYDDCVTHVRWTTTGSMPTGTSFSVSFTVRVK